MNAGQLVSIGDDTIYVQSAELIVGRGINLGDGVEQYVVALQVSGITQAGSSPVTVDLLLHPNAADDIGAALIDGASRARAHQHAEDRS